ncbi:MAG TPA: hypothetical protein VEI02_10510 [Planctomycetota bacterium]|nr:hypothetical protein [Planctomycetota bacterium]
MDVAVRPPPPSTGVLTLEAPAGKSEILRALAVFATRGRGVVRRRGPDADDVLQFVAALTALGAEIVVDREGLRVLRGISRRAVEPARVRIEEGAAPARFLAALAATTRRPVLLETGPRLAARPFGGLFDALRETGARVEASGDAPPATIIGPARGGCVAAALGGETSQFLSALLLAAPAFVEPCEFTVEGPIVSRGYVDLTVETLRAAGARLRVGDGWWLTEPGFGPGVETLEAPTDWSGAAPLLAVAAFLGRPVRVPGLRSGGHPDAAFAGSAAALGLDVTFAADGAEARPRPPVRAASPRTLDLGGCPDLAPTLAALAALAPGGARLVGAPHLRLKESDRVEGVVALLRAAGVDAAPRDDGLEVTGAWADPAARARAAEVGPFDAPIRGDHRLAQAAALLGLVRPATIRGAECVSKSFPGFFERFPGASVAAAEIR